jgi:hypothetical protein
MISIFQFSYTNALQFCWDRLCFSPLKRRMKLVLFSMGYQALPKRMGDQKQISAFGKANAGKTAVLLPVFPSNLKIQMEMDRWL